MLGHRRKARNNSVRNDEESGGRQSRDPSPSHFGVLNLDSYNHHHHHGVNAQGFDRLFLSMTHGQRRYRQVWTILVPWLRKSWWMKIILVGILVNYSVFYVRYFTMSRPSWIYGSPIPHETVQACLGSINDSTSSGKATSASTAQLQFLKANDPNLFLEWYRFSTNSSSVLGPNHTTRHRLLIAQYSGYGKYAQLLDLVAPINAAYAQYWNCDYVILQGTALTLSNTAGTTSSTTTCPSEPRSTFNKIALLELAYQYRDRYDMVLILDTDTMIVDFKADISTLLPSSSSASTSSSSSSSSPSQYLLAAHRVWSWDWRNTWDINAGITLWNIHHDSYPTVLDQWKHEVLDHPWLVLERNDDQYFLQWVLLQQQGLGGGGFWNRGVAPIYSLTQEFYYHHGTIIRHFKRESSTTWSTTSMDQRVTRIQDTIHSMNCDGSGGVAAVTTSTTTTEGATASSTKIPCPYPLTTKFGERHSTIG